MAIRSQMVIGPIAKGLGAVALVFLTAIATYGITAKLNVETAVQQQQNTSIQQFEESGAQMDVALSNFVDALLDKKEIDEARNTSRAAIALHAAQANALKPLTGDGNIRQYIDGLGNLRAFVDSTDGRKTAKIMAQQHVNLMAYRLKLVDMAKGNVYK